MLRLHFRLYLAMAALSILMMTLQSRHGVWQPLRFIPATVNYLNAAVLDTRENSSRYLRMAFANEDELRALRAENRDLRIKSGIANEIERENGRLRNIIAFTVTEQRIVAYARVISRGSDRWQNTFVIDKGSDHGLRPEMAAITPEGLVGKVVDVAGSYSTVLLVDDPRFSAAVRLEDCRAEAIYSGAGRGRGRLKYLASDSGVREGERLITSGLDALFPPGVAVGFANSLEIDEREMFVQALALPAVDTSKVEEVVIIER